MSTLDPTQAPQFERLNSWVQLLQECMTEIIEATFARSLHKDTDVFAKDLEIEITAIINGIEKEFDDNIRNLARLEGTEFVVDDDEASQSDYENPEDDDEAEFSKSTSEERSEILSTSEEEDWY